MIDAVLRWLAARFWRGRIYRRDAMRTEWEHMFPGRCVYCAYTRWANTEHGQSLTLGPHDCKEGNSPPHPLPRARTMP